MKIIPAIDLMDGQVVRLFKGDPRQKTIYSDNPLEIAKKWEENGADMIHLVDLDATLSRGSNLSVIQKIVNELQIPVEVAGGLRDKETIDRVVKSATRIVLGTLAFRDEPTLKKLLKTFGNEKIVISVDHFDGKIAISGWQEKTDIWLLDAMNDFLKMGFTEFLLTNVSRDGTLEGPDLKNLEKACNLDNANIIASGGISNLDDVIKVQKLEPFGVILGKALYENKITIQEAKKLT